MLWGKKLRLCGNYNVAIKKTGPKKYAYVTKIEASKWTIGQIKEKFAKGTYELQAIGKYQLIKDTFNGFVAWANFSNDTVFDKKAQDKFIDFTYINNRKAIGRYLCCKSDDIELAARQVAMEWASVGTKKGTQRDTKHNCGISQTICGDSYYCQGDKALTCYADIIEALKATRQQIADGNCTAEDYTQPDNNATGVGTAEPEVATPPVAEIPSDYDYSGTCTDIKFEPEKNELNYILTRI